MNSNSERQAQRLQLAKQFLQQRDAMARMSLTPVDYLAWRLGCSLGEAERLVEAVKESGNS